MCDCHSKNMRYYCIALYLLRRCVTVSHGVLCRCWQDVFSVGSEVEHRGVPGCGQSACLIIYCPQWTVGGMSPPTHCLSSRPISSEEWGGEFFVIAITTENWLIDNIIYNLRIKGHLLVVRPNTEFPLMTCASPHNSYLCAFNINVVSPLIFWAN